MTRVLSQQLHVAKITLCKKLVHKKGHKACNNEIVSKQAPTQAKSGKFNQ